MEIKEQLGYLTGLLETLTKEVKENKQSSEEWRTQTTLNLNKLQKQMDMYATIIRTSKFIIACIIALLTFKLGIVSDLWKAFHG